MKTMIRTAKRLYLLAARRSKRNHLEQLQHQLSFQMSSLSAQKDVARRKLEEIEVELEAVGEA